MREILEASFLYRALTKMSGWFDRQFDNSIIVSAFLREPTGEEKSRSSFFYKLWLAIHRVLAFLYEKLYFNKLLNGSIFMNTYFWCLLTCALAPIVPTLIDIALCAVALVSLVANFARDRGRIPIYSPVNRYILLLSGVYTVCVAVSPTLRESILPGLVFIVFTLFAIVLQSCTDAKRKLNIMINLMVLSGFIVASYGIVQYVLGITGSAAWLDESMFDGIRLRVYSTLQNPNVLAEYLIIIIPVTVACFFKERRIKFKIVYGTAAFVMGICMILTFSRGGWLGLLFAAALFLVILDRRFIFLGIIGLIGLYFVLPSAVVSRFTSIGNMADTSTTYRVYIWIGTLRMLRDYWLGGVGFGMAPFAKVYPAYALNAIAAPHSHNLFLQMTCDCGIVGLFVFLAVIFMFCRTVGGAIKRTEDKELKYILTGSLSALAGFMVQSLTDYTFYNYRVMLIFWVLIALGLTAARLSRKTEGETSHD